MPVDLKKFPEYWRVFVSRLRMGHDSGPIDTIEKLEDFTVTRAAFIAQKTLYGYVKARMGTRYPEMFRDDAIINSVNIAKMHHFAACLSDLSVFVIGRTFADAANVRDDVALRLFTAGLARNADPSIQAFSPIEAEAAFRLRLQGIEWQGPFDIRGTLTHSPVSIMKWAPISEDLKKYDTEYVENSVKFAWIDVVTRFDKRIDADAVRNSTQFATR